MKVGTKVYKIVDLELKELVVIHSSGKRHRGEDKLTGKIYPLGYETATDANISSFFFSRIVGLTFLEEQAAKYLTKIREEIKEYKLQFFNKGSDKTITREDIEKELWPYDDKQVEKENQ